MGLIYYSPELDELIVCAGLHIITKEDGSNFFDNQFIGTFRMSDIEFSLMKYDWVFVGYF